jgi:hypothetical protein
LPFLFFFTPAHVVAFAHSLSLFALLYTLILFYISAYVGVVDERFKLAVLTTGEALTHTHAFTHTHTLTLSFFFSYPLIRFYSGVYVGVVDERFKLAVLTTGEGGGVANTWQLWRDYGNAPRL